MASDRHRSDVADCSSGIGLDAAGPSLRPLTQADLAERTGLSLKHINQIAQGIAPITPETSLRFERVTGVPARRWNALEAKYRERLVRKVSHENLADDVDWLDELPIQELVRRGHIDSNADKPAQVEQALRFFGVADRERWQRLWLTPLVSFRQSPSFAADVSAVATWLRLGELEAMELETAPFDAKRFRAALTEARALTRVEPKRVAQASTQPLREGRRSRRLPA